MHKLFTNTFHLHYGKLKHNVLGAVSSGLFQVYFVYLGIDKQGTPEEGWRIQRPKHCVSTYHYKDEDNSLKITIKIIHIKNSDRLNSTDKCMNKDNSDYRNNAIIYIKGKKSLSGSSLPMFFLLHELFSFVLFFSFSFLLLFYLCHLHHQFYG